MSPVWKPVLDPPSLDQFCHLSHDAQRVMLAIYEDFSVRKRELLQSISTTERSTDPKNYYQSIYEARFGQANDHFMNQYNSSGNNQTENRVHRLSEGHQEFSAKTTRENLDNRHTSSSRDVSDASWPEQLQVGTGASYESSKYSDSPPIETQGYRFLSQLTRTEASQEQHGTISLNIEDKNANKLGPNEIGALSLHTWSKSDVYEGVLEDGIQEFCSEKESNSPLLSDDSVATSQSLFSQDHTLGHKIRSIKRRVKSRQKIHSITPRNSENSLELPSKAVKTADRRRTSAMSDQENRSGCFRKTNAKTCIIESDCRDTVMNISVGEESMKIGIVEDGNDCGTAKMKAKSLDKEQNHETDVLHGDELEKSVDNMNLEGESPFMTDDGQISSSATGAHIYESPFDWKEQTKMSYVLRLSSGQKQDSGLPPICEKKPVTEDSLSGMSKKRLTVAKGFRVPVKKAKIDHSDVKILKNSKRGSVVEVSTLPTDKKEQIINKLLGSAEVVISLVYESGATQLRNSLFAQETKSRSTVKTNQAKIRGIACACKNVQDTVFLFQFVQSNNPFYQIVRDFLLKLLKAERRKIGLHVKEIFTEVLRYIQWDISKVDTAWTILDPILAVWLLDPDNPVGSFDELLQRTGMPPMSPSDSCLDILYEDLMLLSVAMERLHQKLQHKELWDLFICVETKLTPLLAALELTSLPVATHTLMQFSEILKKKCSKLEKEAHQAAGHAFLLTSPAQLRQVLFEELRLDTKLPSNSRLARTSVSNQTSTSESVLSQLTPFHPLPSIVLEYRQVQKLKSTYIDGILSCVEDDCVRTNWDQTAAATGRLTAYQPNVQAIPKIPVTITRYKECYIAGQDADESIDIYARDAFVSQTGWTLLAADFQQIELRLLAHLADDPILLKLFSDKDIPDIFNALTAQWLGKSISDISTVEREQTKRVVYSIMYGVGKEKLAEHLKIGVNQAKAIMASFLAKFPAVRHFTQTCVDFCQKNGYCCSIFKRRRLIPNIKHPSPVLRAQAERQAVNFCVQGSAADVCKAAMLQVVHALSERPTLKARLLMQIHDELLLEAADSDLHQVTGLVKEIMESSDKLCGSAIRLRVTLPVSLSCGKTWGHMEPITEISTTQQSAV